MTMYCAKTKTAKVIVFEVVGLTGLRNNVLDGVQIPHGMAIGKFGRGEKGWHKTIQVTRPPPKLLLDYLFTFICHLPHVPACDKS